MTTVESAPRSTSPADGGPSWPGPDGPLSAAPPPHRWRVRAATGLAALVLAASAGLAGGYLAHRGDGSPSRSTTTVTAGGVLGRDALAKVAAAVEPSVVSISTGTAEGSGVVLDRSGYVLTNNHVVATAQGNTVRLTFSNGSTATAAIVGTDPANDLAVVKAAGASGLIPATFGDSDQIQVGDTVLAIGSPLGLDGTVTEGIISGLHRNLGAGQGGGRRGAAGESSTIADAIQTDAAINPGNSGGALVDSAGRVIGINTAIATNGQSEGNIGVGFAIPSNTAKQVAQKIIRNG
jgi:putative serine protease PepD